MKNIVIWAVCIVTLGFVLAGMELVFAGSGIPVYLDSHGAASISEMLTALLSDQQPGELTDPGVYAIFVAVMLAWRLYHILQSGRIDGGLPLRQHALWNYSLIGASLYLAASLLLWKAALPVLLAGILNLGFALIVFYCFYKKYQTLPVEGTEKVYETTLASSECQ